MLIGAQFVVSEEQVAAFLVAAVTIVFSMWRLDVCVAHVAGLAEGM